jgi:hypothetical protein
MKKLTGSYLIILAGMFFSTHAVRSEEQTTRPPQFVLMAFDNCTEVERWQEWTDFLKDMNRDQTSLHFTFFLSGINFLAQENRNSYKGPLETQARGYSPIGFGGTPDDVRKRVGFINASRASGNEIASHAVGHFYGEDWSLTNWLTEFDSYNQLFKNVALNNDFPDSEKFAFNSSAIVGFRAPQLSFGPPLYQALRKLNFRYDTSENGEPDAWPVRQGGVWRFKLANIAVSGTEKKRCPWTTISL